MKITRSILSSLCLVGLLSWGVAAQDKTPPKKIPQLTMEDFDNRTAAPVSSSTPIVTNENSVAANPGKKTETPARASLSTNVRLIVDSAWRKMANLNSGRMQITYQTATGEGESYFFEFAGTDRMRMIKERGEIIAIASTIYAKMHGEEWQKLPAKEAGQIPEISYKSFAKSFTVLPAQVQLVSEEIMDQRPVLKMKLSDKQRDSGYAWIGKDDGWVYKLEGTSSSSGGYVKMIFSHHNADISITPPVPPR